MNKTVRLLLLCILFVTAIILNLFGLMRIAPLLITLPLLFITIYYALSSLFHRHTFRGFK